MDKMTLFDNKENDVFCEGVIDSRSPMYLDATFKRIFSKKKVSAYLLSFVVPEFKGMNVDDVIACIDAAIDKEYLAKNPDEIYLESTEHGTGIDKVIRFDVLFKIKDKFKKATILIDLEMQNTVTKSSLKYDIFDRMIYYSARSIADQLTQIDNRLQYNHLDKTYNIWIIGKDATLFKDEYSVHNFSIMENDNKVQSPFDLLNIITIELKKLTRDDREVELSNYLQSIFNSDRVGLSDYFTERELFTMREEWNFEEALREELTEVLKEDITQQVTQQVNIDYILKMHNKGLGVEFIA